MERAQSLLDVAAFSVLLSLGFVQPWIFAEGIVYQIVIEVKSRRRSEMKMEMEMEMMVMMMIKMKGWNG